MPSTARFACFATALGECALAWNETGLTGIWLPESHAGGLKRKIEGRVPMPIESAPSDKIALVIAAIQRLLAGEPEDLRAVRLDWSAVPDLARRVYDLAREVAPGRVVTYGWLAHQLGDDADARAVGQALGANPFPIVVPCHRVIRSDGTIGNYGGGVENKLKLLRVEGFEVGDDLRLPQGAVMGHRTTKIFCNPDCSAAKRTDSSRQLIFADISHAQQAGLRACKLCNPT